MMSDRSSASKRESFELFEERFIFDDYDFFLYSKYSCKCKKETTSFLQARKLSPKNEAIFLHQRDDEPTNAEIIRSVAINCGSNVVSVCFSSMALTDMLVEGLLPHLCKLEYLQLNGVNIGSVTARAISTFCHNTLKSLRVSGCHLITSESMGWLAGIIGHNSPRLCQLKALDASSTRIDDRGIAHLSKGLGQLECLDVANCPQLTFTGRGIEDSLRSGSLSSMLVLNLHGCKGIGDEGVVALAKVMTRLRHLNLGHCGNITNRSASTIGQGCTQLKSLSIEGAVGVNDAGLGMIAAHTKLNLLNINGCSISRKSLLAVILSLGYVQESFTFFGFVIKDFDAREVALSEEEMAYKTDRENRAAHTINNHWKAKRSIIHQVQSVHERDEQKAATRIQSFLIKCRSRRRFDEVGYRWTAAVSSVRIQKMIRGWLERRRMRRLRLRNLRMTYYSRLLQKRYRGKFVRSHDTLVMPAILALRAARLSERRRNAATVIQCFWRTVRATLRLRLLRRQYSKRRKSSVHIQRIGRSMFGKLRSKKFRLFAELHEYYQDKMAIRIQCFLRQCVARLELDKCLQRAAECYLIEYKMARILQSFCRGVLARLFVQRRRLAWNAAAVEIQRTFRGYLVPTWLEMKMDAVSKYIYEKADIEIATSLKTRQTYTQPSKEVEALCTNDDNVEITYEVAPDGTPGDDELLRYVFGRSFVSFQCLIYWPDMGLYKRGTISAYDDRMRLWQINNNEDNNEWLDLVREKDRVLVREENGADWTLYSYCRPLPMAQYLEKRKAVEPSNSTWTPPESEDEVASAMWYCAYLARGLLDDCYNTQSGEALHKFRSAHLVKALTVSIAKVKYMRRDVSEMEQFECLLMEVEEFVRVNLAVDE